MPCTSVSSKFSNGRPIARANILAYEELESFIRIFVISWKLEKYFRANYIESRNLVKFCYKVDGDRWKDGKEKEKEKETSVRTKGNSVWCGVRPLTVSRR